MLVAGWEKFLFEDRAVFFLPLFLGAQTGMRDLQGEVEEEGAVLLLFEILEGFGGDDGGRVVVAVVESIFGVGDFVVIPPEVVRIVKVGRSVGGEAEEVIKALFAGERGVVGITAEAGLPNHRGVVACFLHRAGKNWLMRIFTHLKAAIPTDVNVSGVFAFEKAAPRWCANGTPGIVTGEFHPLGRHAIEVGGFDDLLSVTPEITVAEIVSEDVNDIGLLGWGREGKKEEDGEKASHGGATFVEGEIIREKGIIQVDFSNLQCKLGRVNFCCARQF